MIESIPSHSIIFYSILILLVSTEGNLYKYIFKENLWASNNILDFFLLYNIYFGS